MKHYRGAVFFDIDGTLIVKRRGIDRIPSSAASAIESLKKSGYFTCVATGRSDGCLPDFGDLLEGYITCNGAAAKIGKTRLYETFFSRDLIRRFMAYMNQNRLGYILENTEGGYYTPFGGAAYQSLAARLASHYACVLPIERMEAEKFSVSKIQIACDTAVQYEGIKAAFDGEIDIAPHRYELAADVAPAGVSKAGGILKILKMLDIDPKNTYAFGDDHNDVTMLKTVAHGVAMTPCIPALKQDAEYVTKMMEEDGIYLGLRHFGLVDINHAERLAQNNG